MHFERPPARPRRRGAANGVVLIADARPAGSAGGAVATRRALAPHPAIAYGDGADAPPVRLAPSST
jgi:hypothetical protein